MDTVIKIIILVVCLYIVLRWLSHRKKRIRITIEPSMLGGKMRLICSIHSDFEPEPITIMSCQLVVNNQISLSTFSDRTVQLPYTIKAYEGTIFVFDPVPLATEARKKGQKSFKVSSLFKDSTHRTYRSRSMTIPTEARQFTELFESYAEHFSAPMRTVWKIAQAFADQLNQQYVGIPHVVLGLLREPNGVGGAVLRKLGLEEDFLFQLAIVSPNSPRNHEFPQPHSSKEFNELTSRFMPDEARKMHNRCQGTGHLLLGLIQQKNEAFLTILTHLNMQPRQLRTLIYEALLTDQYKNDHLVLPPKGNKRYIWAIWYQLTHNILIRFWSFIEWLYPDLEI